MGDDDSDADWLVERVGPGSPAETPRSERVAQYRREAAAVRAKAASVTDSTVRQQLLDIAHQYDVLAISIERLGPSRGQ